MKAKLTNLLTGKTIDVESTTEHPMSSYGIPVWVDKDNNAYGQINMPIFGYEIRIEK